MIGVVEYAITQYARDTESTPADIIVFMRRRPVDIACDLLGLDKSFMDILARRLERRTA